VDSKERYGRFVLQFEDARTSAGSLFRAVQLGPAGYERHVQLFRSEMLSAEVAQRVADGLKSGLQVQHAQIARGFEAGRIDKTAFAASELFEGRSVGALLERSSAERHPFAADHALLIASKAAAALEAAQAKKQIHGFLIPEFIHVSHDGEVSVRGFGLSPRILRDANCVGVREAGFLAPEVEGNAPLDIRADVFSLGAQLFEMLTGLPLPRNQSLAAALEAARVQSPGSDGSLIPAALANLLTQSLAEDPGRRFKDAAQFKKAVDTLLFSGDYSPTTFNLAFFMHTLFRDEGDQDAALIKAERNADYRSHVAAMAAGHGTVFVSMPALPVPATGVRSADTVRIEAPRPEATRPDSSRLGRVPTPGGPPPVAPAHSAPVPAPADDPVLQTVLAEKKGFPIAPVAVGVVAVIAIAAYFLTRSGPALTAPATSPTMNAAETAALARVRELEARLAAMETERAAAEQKATEEATKRVEAQARARGRAVDPLELQKAQEEARKKAQAEQEALVQAERQKIEDARRKAEETRAAEAAKAAEATKAAEAAAQPSVAPSLPPVASSPAGPPPVVPAAASPAPSLTVAPAPQAGVPAATPAPAPAGAPAPGGAALLDISDPAVSAPVLLSQSRIEYPPVARAQRISGVVIISALVDETGAVIDTRVIRGASPNPGFTQAALKNVKSRKYKPATMNGKPGRAWVAIQIDFKL